MARDRERRGKDSKAADRRRTPKKKVSILNQDSIDWVDYKDVNLLRRFMSERAKIRARRVTWFEDTETGRTLRRPTFEQLQRAIFNGAGRVFWAWVSDYIGRSRVYLLLYAIQAVIFFALPRMTSVGLFSAALAIIGLCYGGGFGTMPSFTADFFGSKFMGGIYGWILLAWGAGAIPSPLLIARLRQTTGQYEQAIYTIAFVMLIATVLPFLIKRPEPPAVAPGQAVAGVGRSTVA